MYIIVLLQFYDWFDFFGWHPPKTLHHRYNYRISLVLSLQISMSVLQATTTVHRTALTLLVPSLVGVVQDIVLSTTENVWVSCKHI